MEDKYTVKVRKFQNEYMNGKIRNILNKTSGQNFEKKIVHTFGRLHVLILQFPDLQYTVQRTGQRSKCTSVPHPQAFHDECIIWWGLAIVFDSLVPTTTAALLLQQVYKQAMCVVYVSVYKKNICLSACLFVVKGQLISKANFLVLI